MSWYPIPRYDFTMTPNAQRILEDAQQLPLDEKQWLAERLLAAANEDAFAAIEKEFGEPEPGYEEWFRMGVEEALEDTSEGVPHNEAMKHFHDALQKARKMKRTA